MAVQEVWNFNKKSSEIISQMKLESNDTSPDHDKLRIESAFVVGNVGGSYDTLENLPTVDGSPIVGDYLLGDGLSIVDKTISLDDGIVRRVRAATTAQWNVEPSYVPNLGQVIIYTDYMTVSGVNYVGIKIGDGSSFIVDLPFLCGEIKSTLESHIANTQAHVSAYDREYWNGKNKVSESVEDEVLMITL